jgi:uncharacterized RDD family membrane protein YckC
MSNPELLAQVERVAEIVEDEIQDGKTSIERYLDQNDGFAIHEKLSESAACEVQSSSSLRFLAFLVDVLVILFLSFLFSLLSQKLPQDWSQILQDAYLNNERARSFLFSLFLAAFLYPLCAYIFASQTLGQWVFGIGFRDEDGYPLSFLQRSFLALTSPLSILCGSTLALPLGRPSFHEYLTGSRSFLVERENLKKSGS